MKYIWWLCNILFDEYLNQGDEKLKFSIKKIMSYLISVTALVGFLISSEPGKGLDIKISPMAKTSETAKEEESNNFNFIKSDEKVKDFIYDGSVFLYGGILLITISCLGIFFTLKPKKKKPHRNKTNINK